MARTRERLPALPRLLNRKIYKTGQTRGADDDEIYQNRVSRSSTVLIPYSCWGQCRTPHPDTHYANGAIVLISPADYFPGIARGRNWLADQGLTLGENALVFYEARSHWNAHNPTTLGWTPASRRISPLGGQYVARISATTATEDADAERISHGFTAKQMKGAGIRVYEYASSSTIEQCRLQLEALFWCCTDAEAVVVANGMSRASMTARKASVLARSLAEGLFDTARLTAARVLDERGTAICPLCREGLSANGFFERLVQAEGRGVLDLTVTQVNLFHIAELRVGTLNHAPYNVGWGHHHCNVVVKDSGITETLRWMKAVVDRNTQSGNFPN